MKIWSQVSSLSALSVTYYMTIYDEVLSLVNKSANDWISTSVNCLNDDLGDCLRCEILWCDDCNGWIQIRKKRSNLLHKNFTVRCNKWLFRGRTWYLEMINGRIKKYWITQYIHHYTMLYDRVTGYWQVSFGSVLGGDLKSWVRGVLCLCEWLSCSESRKSLWYCI